MRRRAVTTRARRRVGGILFEVLISLALFVGAATFALGAVGSALTALERSGREALALDLARSKMAELETGLITMADLQDARDGIMRVGSYEEFGAIDDRGSDAIRWVVSVTNERTEFRGLTLVELTVEEAQDGFSDATPARATLRQLVALHEEEEGEFEIDELLEGLPTGVREGESP